MAEVTFTIRGITRKQIAIIVIGLFVVGALIVAGFLFTQQYAAGQSRLPYSSYKDLGFQVFFPEKAPDGFTFDKDSVSSTSQVLTYGYQYDGKPLSVSVQPLDPQMDIGSFKPTRELSLQIGKAYLVEYEERTTIAIVADKTFIIVNSPQQIPSANVEQFARSLRLVRKP